MSDSADCCTEGKPIPRQRACPACGRYAQRVSAVTVAAMTTKPLLHSSRFWVCQTPSCDVAYFDGDSGSFAVSDLKVRPGFKKGGDLICYCFGFTRVQIRDQPSTIDAIRKAVSEQQCACQVRNPTGKCCLPDVQACLPGHVQRG